MTRVSSGIQWLPIFVGGAVGGFLLALVTHADAIVTYPSLAVLVTMLPFMLAAVTGAAKTTTA